MTTKVAACSTCGKKKEEGELRKLLDGGLQCLECHKRSMGLTPRTEENRSDAGECSQLQAQLQPQPQEQAQKQLEKHQRRDEEESFTDRNTYGSDDLFVDYTNGLIPVQVDLLVPPDAPVLVQRVALDFATYVGLRYATGKFGPVPYPRRKVAERLQISPTAVGNALKYLEDNEVVRKTGYLPPLQEDWRGTNLYEPLSPSGADSVEVKLEP